MQIDAIRADSHRVGIRDRAVFSSRGVGDVLLPNGVFGLDTPRLADVHVLGKTVACTDYVGSDSEAREAGASVGARRLGLHPVQHAEAQLPCALEMALSLGGIDLVYGT
jgi:hypothetical protein